MSELQVSISYGSTGNTTQEAMDSDTPAEFQGFANLTEKLVQVPKSELDDKLKES